MAATHHLLHAGYVRDDGVAASVSLVIDGKAVIVVDPGMVADRSSIIGPLREHGIETGQVTHVAITHHHPDHTVNVGPSRTPRWWTSGPDIVTTSGSTTRATDIGSVSTRA